MTRHVAFLRAINVGGRIVRMGELRAIFEAAGLAAVSTFIASGNVIFESRKVPAQLEKTIERALAHALGYEVATMLRSVGELADVADLVERKSLAPGGVRLYVGFLKSMPTPGAAKAVAALSNDVDALAVHGRELYWQCAAPFSESTVTGARIEKLLQTPATFRNYTTVSKLVAKCGA